MPSAADKRRKQARAAAQASSSGQEQLPLRPAGQATSKTRRFLQIQHMR